MVARVPPIWKGPWWDPGNQPVGCPGATDLEAIPSDRSLVAPFQLVLPGRQRFGGRALEAPGAWTAQTVTARTPCRAMASGVEERQTVQDQLTDSAVKRQTHTLPHAPAPHFRHPNRPGIGSPGRWLPAIPAGLGTELWAPAAGVGYYSKSSCVRRPSRLERGAMASSRQLRKVNGTESHACKQCGSQASQRGPIL